MPRIAHLLRPAQGGMRAQVRALIQSAPADQPPLLAAPADVLEALSNAVPDADRRFPVTLAGGGPPAMLNAGRLVGRWARAQGAQLLHGHGLRWTPLFLSAAVTAQLPLVVTLHNLVPAGEDMSGIERAALKTAFSRVGRVIAVSQAVAESARSLVDPGRVTVVYNGVNADLYQLTPDESVAVRTRLRQELRLPDDALVVATVARLAVEKDIATLLEAASLLRDKYPALHLLIVGDGKRRASLEWQAKFLGLAERIRFTGARNDIPELLTAADLFCQPSREEGLGIAAIEASISRLPVVASNVGGLPEVVMDGKTGLLAPVGDIVAFANALDRLLADPELRRTQGNAGRERALSLFTEDAMIEATERVYADVLARK